MKEDEVLQFETMGGHPCLKQTSLSLPRYVGKVRDIYELEDDLLLVSTDRLSAFDRAIALIPFKGEVLTQLSKWWFEKTKSIVDNHVIDLPFPQVMRVKKCKVLPIEVVVRGAITGSTQTSLWTLYEQGQRRFFGTHLKEGLRKNEVLPAPILTPTSKSKTHDRPLELSDLKDIPGLSPALWEAMASIALRLFTEANAFLASRGLMMADTKYEFGLDQEGKLCLVDEVHTSDSSRYWDLKDWQEALSAGREPHSFDKELIRLWYRAHTRPYEDAILIQAPAALLEEVSQRYQQLYHRITGQDITRGPLTCAALSAYLAKKKLPQNSTKV